ncbi:MAG: flagellar biosynthesis anti-sigma factor FlgM [Bryobacteraceae bacterium]|nr:flagellar biosynthesis anti-sigma factor FlgM [Bryobacteraceae bacterium]
MRIADTGLPYLERAAEAGKVDGQAVDKRGAAVAGGDAVQISRLAAAVRALAPGSPERAGRLAQLEGAVESGRYRVDAERVGRSILEEALLAA